MRLSAIGFTLIMLVYLMLPLAVAAAASVSEAAFLAFPPQGFTLDWYGRVLADPRWVDAGLTGLAIALPSSLGAVLLGTAAALALVRHRPRGAAWIELLFLSPLLLPTIVLALGSMILAAAIIGRPTVWAVIGAHVVLGVPYVLRTTTAVLETIDPNAEDAARTMGAGWWARTFLVLLPQARGGIVAGGLLAFIMSFDDAVVILFLRAPTLETLPTRVYAELEFNPGPTVAAVSTLLIMTTALAVLAVERLIGSRKLAGV
jgi:putative spermidine/putrescine transport system permease protein